MMMPRGASRTNRKSGKATSAGNARMNAIAWVTLDFGSTTVRAPRDVRFPLILDSLDTEGNDL